ncbi:MAG: preprotein translocase subunit TatA, partial [Candidatus Neomarinimicrobiota bacterium]
MIFKYSYPALERVEKNEMRFYKDANDDLVPSVTTVLDATGDKSGITQWRRKVGPAQADAIVQES